MIGGGYAQGKFEWLVCNDGGGFDGDDVCAICFFFLFAVARSLASCVR